MQKVRINNEDELLVLADSIFIFFADFSGLSSFWKKGEKDMGLG